MYIVEDAKRYETSPNRAYVSEPDQQEMVHMTNKKSAKRFATSKEAKAYLRDYKWRMADFNIQRMKDLVVKEDD